MNNLIVKFDDLWDLTLKKVEKLIKGERDEISKRWIGKKYRQFGVRSLKEVYGLYYKTKLWREGIAPLLRMWEEN